MEKSENTQSSVTKPAEAEKHESHEVNKKNRSSRMWIIIGAVILLVLGFGGWYMQSQSVKTPVEPKTLKIGLITADSPDAGTSTSGGSIKDSVELAQKEVKVEGITTEIIFKGTGCEKDLVAKAMDEFATQGVVAVIGEQCSGATLAGVPTANSKKIVMISPASSSPKLTTEGGDYFFRTIPSDSLASDFTANYIYKKGSRSLAIIYGDEPYGIGLKDGIKATFEKLGGKVVALEAVPDTVNTTNVTKIAALINDIKASKADAIYAVTNVGTTNVTIVTKINELKLNVPVYAGELFSDETFVKSAGSVAEKLGLKIINITQGTPDFIEKSQAAWGTEPHVYAAQAYDAYTAIMKAVEKGAYTGEAIQAALGQVEFDGASGHIKFDQYGDVAGNYSVFTIKDGKLRQASE